MNFLSRFSKHILICFNSLFAICGIILIAIFDNENKGLASFTDFSVGGFAIAVGLFVFFVGVFGCYGAFTENSCLLKTVSIYCWTRIRGNHRQALNLGKTESEQAASKMKLPKFSQDEEQREADLSPVHASLATDSEDKHEEEATVSSRSSITTERRLSSPIDSDTFNSPAKTAKKEKRTEPAKQLSAAAVLQNDYLHKKENTDARVTDNQDPLIEFFLNMAHTVQKFSVRNQLKIKAELFQSVNTVEMQLARKVSVTQEITSSIQNDNTSVPHTSYQEHFDS